MGSFSYSNSVLPLACRIGRYCSIAGGLSLLGSSHPLDRLSSSPFTYEGLPVHQHLQSAVEDFAPTYTYAARQPRRLNPWTTIAHDVWIGQDVRLARGIHVGTGSVIAAGAVVTKDVPPYHVVGGIPARTLKVRFPDDIVRKLLASEWWTYRFTDFEPKSVLDPDRFCDWLGEQAGQRKIEPFEPKSLTAADLLAAESTIAD
nr:CatB-related O-acetyltransferase [Pararoseomonas indoligenes]